MRCEHITKTTACFDENWHRGYSRTLSDFQNTTAKNKIQEHVRVPEQINRKQEQLMVLYEPCIKLALG